MKRLNNIYILALWLALITSCSAFGQTSVVVPDDGNVPVESRVISDDEVIIAGSPEEQIEQLILDAFSDVDIYIDALDQAQALTEKLRESKADFFQVYIQQCRLRIAASKVSLRQQNGEDSVELSLQARLVAQELAKSAEQMNQVRDLLTAKLDTIKMYNQKQRARVQSLIYRCDYCNGWAYYTISTIVTNGLKNTYIEQAEKVFTSFLGRKFQAVNMPVMVNCLYGKGLCLRDSGRYYDLIVMLDTMAVSQNDAVKFARLRLAASVKLSLSVEILRVVQDYFDEDAISDQLNVDELEMLVNCIEAGVKLLDRDLPLKMKESLRKQLVKAVERTEGYGKYWQDRVSGLVSKIDLSSPYVKLLQVYDFSSKTDGKDYEKIYKLADEGLKLCHDSQLDKRSEFLYLKVVSSWNSHKYEQTWNAAVDFLNEFIDNQHSSQVADIACQAAMKLVAADSGQYDKADKLLVKMRDENLISDLDYKWTCGCMKINSGHYKEGYEYFCRDDVIANLPVKRHYGILLAILPMLKASEIDEQQAADSIIECCEVFTSSGSSFVQTNHFVEAAEIICEIAQIFLDREKYELLDEVLTVIDSLPHIRGDLYARYMGVKLSYDLTKGNSLESYIDEITANNLYNEPVIFNLLVNESRKLEVNGSGNDQLLVKVYRLLLSSELLDDKNAVAVRIYLAQCYYRLENYQSYLNLAEGIAKNYPMHISVSFYRQMAIAYRQQQQFSKSAEHWNTVLQSTIEMKEGWKEALYNKILCYNNAGDTKKASQTLQLTLLRNPQLLTDKVYGQRFKELQEELENN